MDDSAKPTAEQGGDTKGNDHHSGADGHGSDVPEDSPATESDVSLSQQVADREPEGTNDEK